MKRKKLYITSGLLALLAIVGARKGYLLAADPVEERKCDFNYPEGADESFIEIFEKDISQSGLLVSQRGGTINDASCLNKTHVYAIARINSEADIKNALEFAELNNLEVTPAGVQHSMGGQSFVKGGLVLDMKGLNDIQVNEENLTMRVQSGATWKQVQEQLDPEGLAVKAMQSINLFSVGGTLSVNAHGIVHNPGQIAPTVRSMRVMLSSGEIINTSPTENVELFGAVLGGYGLNGIILDVELDIVENKVYEWKKEYMDYKEFSSYYQETVVGKDNVEFAYGRLSISPGSYLKELAMHRYETVEDNIEPQLLKPASKVWIKRFIFNFSKRGDLGRWTRWMAEKHLEPGVHQCISRNQLMAGQDEIACVASRNEKMNQSMEYLEGRDKDTNILHEYFIPEENTTEFIDGLREIVQKTNANLLNVTLRIVTKDEITALPYAKDDRIAFVLYFNQELNTEDSKILQETTTELIDLTTSLNGTFYLPYQLYYSDSQLRDAYPEVDDFFELKNKYDPQGLLSNSWYKKYGPKNQ